MPHVMRRTRLVSLVALTLAAASAFATDLPIDGKRVAIAAKNASRRTFVFSSAVESAIAAPLPDPTAGAALRVFVSNAAGQCHTEIELPAGAWRAIGQNGPTKGWRYRDPDGTAQGVRSVVLSRRARGGRITVKARGAFPCGLEAAQAGPLWVELRIATTRYCAAFGGTRRKNEVGRYRAADAPAPAACLDDDVTVADLNVLHGVNCPAATAGCRRADRVELLRQFVVARGCPDVLAFEEVYDAGPGNENAQMLQTALTNTCPKPYAVAYHRTLGVDDEMILSRHPFLVDEIVHLLGPFRTVLHVRIDHPAGAVDVYATHLASSSDLATMACGAVFGACPPECVAAGAATVRDCQAVQTAALVDSTRDSVAPAFVVGDFNESPGSFVYAQFASRGWSDAYLAAGNPECDPTSGVGCTSGRIDDALTDMESPALAQTERIDFVWLVPPGAGSLCGALVEPAGDPDGDGVQTRLFADVPNPFAPPCGPSPAAICWPSDHTGVQADVNCH